MSKGIKILQHIAESGICSDIPGDPCSHCPLARLKKRPNGDGWLSCLEAVESQDDVNLLDDSTESISHRSPTDLYIEDIRRKYKKAAENKLIDMAIESALSEESRDED